MVRISLVALHLSGMLAVAATASGQPAGGALVTPRSALSDPSLSPDGREIAFIAGGDVWTVATGGGVARLLVAHPATESRPLFSPDGRSLAFVSTRTGGGDIYVLDIASGTLSRRTFDDGRDGLDAWSRDGKTLYFTSSSGDVAGMNDIWRVPAAGGQPVAVAADRYASEYWAAPSPDGRALAITARGSVSGQWWRHGHSHIDESEIWTVRNLESGAPVYERVGDAGGGKDAWPMWLDGQTLYYMSDRNGQENLWRRTIGGSARAVTRFGRGRVLWPSMAYDGSAIVFERDFGIWRYDVAKDAATEVPITLRGVVAEASAERQTLSQGFRALAVSPDTRKAAFIARGELFVVGARDGGEATRLTASVETEDTPEWLPDSRRVVWASNTGNAWHLRLQDVSTRSERELTRGAGRDVAPRVSPDGKLVAYQRNGRELRVVGVDGTDDRRLAESDFSEAPFVSRGAVAWAPDSRWLAFVKSDARGFANVWVTTLDGGAPRQVSFGSDANVGDVLWSPDGTYLLYRSAMRTETPRIVRVDLQPRTPRFREDQFRDLFGPTSPVTPPVAPGQPSVPGAPVVSGASGAAAAPRDSARTASPRRPVVVAFDNIRLRASMRPTQGLGVGDMAISPDGRTLVFVGSAGGQQQIYAWSLDELARESTLRALTTSAGNKSELHWSADSRELWYLEGGRISAVVVESRAARSVAATAEVDVNFAAEKQAIFRQAWTFLGRNFFDERMNGVDWPALATKIEPYVEGSRTPDDLRRVLSLMIGELNASHLGISGPTPGAVSIPVGRLGVRFDRAALERDGSLVVSEIIAQGPAAVANVRLGERIASVDGVPVRAGLSVDSLLMGKVGRRVVLSVIASAGGASGGAAREVVVRPVNLGTEKGLVYRQWVEERRAYVAKASGGRLGYVHMLDMGQPSLDQLYLDLDAENQAREGVVVDVRNNNGGFVNVYAIDVLARRNYLNFTDRGTGVVTPARSGLGQRMLDRPTILVTNQQTLSDGEDFTEGYRTLGLGKVVGEPTAGWIIFTSNVTLLDGATSLRLPSTRVSDNSGKDMEMNPRPVDIPVVRPIGESYAGKDSQLDAAVQALLGALPKRP
jgi:Tol biopolymer transport system component/C-terminal processing protease CtpA/Prc